MRNQSLFAKWRRWREGIGFFRLNQQGKIELEREFFDLDYFIAELQK